jgi:hypothetical protein
MTQNKIARRAEWILEIARGMAEKLDKQHKSYNASNRIEEIRLNYAGYEEPGYSTPEHGVVAVGDWNSFSIWDSNQGTYLLHKCYLASRVQKLFEKLGIPCEWSDEWAECGECYSLIRTKANSYGWLPSYVQGDGDITCHTCIEKDPEAYLLSLEDNPDTAITLDVDPCDYGYKQVGEEYETGWHPGQDDDPKDVAKELRAKDITRFVFKITETGQFDSRWAVYVHESEFGLLGDDESVESEESDDNEDDV